MPAMPVASSSRLSTPPPEVLTRPLTPEPEEPEEDVLWSIYRRPSESLSDCVDFHVFIPDKPGNIGSSQKNSKKYWRMSAFHSSFEMFLHRLLVLSMRASLQRQ
jgi:hypothetical protein